MESRTRFLFRGKAVAIAGDIRRPKRLRIPAQCSVALPSIGGSAQTNSPGGKFGDLVVFASAAASVEGDYCDKDGKSAADFTFGNHSDNNLPSRTVADSMVSGLAVTVADRSVSHTLNAASVRATLVSDHPGRGGEPSIRMERLEISGLSVDGIGLDVVFHDLFTRYPTRKSLEESFLNETAHAATFDRCLFTRPGYTAPKGRRVLPEEGGILCGTVVKEIKWSREPHPAATLKGNVVIVPGLGSVHLGEIFISSNERRLTMMRFEIGCPEGGELTVVETIGDGHLWPP